MRVCVCVCLHAATHTHWYTDRRQQLPAPSQATFHFSSTRLGNPRISFSLPSLCSETLLLKFLISRSCFGGVHVCAWPGGWKRCAVSVPAAVFVGRDTDFDFLFSPPPALKSPLPASLSRHQKSCKDLLDSKGIKAFPSFWESLFGKGVLKILIRLLF